MNFAYYNGIYGKYENIRIPLYDRSIFFGDGVYDAAIGGGGIVYLEDEHIERLLTNAKRMKLPLAFSKSALADIIRKTVKQSGLAEYFVYIQISRYSRERIHAYENTDRSNLLVTVKEFHLPSEDRRVKLMSFDDIRHHMCDIKTLNILPSVIAAKEAEERGYDEVVFHRSGRVTECAHSNVAMIKNGTLYTPPTDNLILPGITRRHLLKSCETMGIPYKEIPFSTGELTEADEILISSTSKLCVLASQIDKISLKNQENSIGKRLCTRLRADFLGAIQENC